MTWFKIIKQTEHLRNPFTHALGKLKTTDDWYNGTGGPVSEHRACLWTATIFGYSQEDYMFEAKEKALSLAIGEVDTRAEISQMQDVFDWNDAQTDFSRIRDVLQRAEGHWKTARRVQSRS